MKKKRKKTKHAVNKFLIIFSAFTCIALILTVLYYFKKDNNSYCANSISCIKDLSGKYEQATQGVFQGQKIIIPQYISQENREETILGEATGGGNKHIYVDLTNQRLSAYEGNNLVYSFLVSTGKWYPTPTGDFRIWIKLRYTRMTGGNPAWGTYYDLPNVPFTMYFYNNQYPKTRGFGLHGAYWHHNWGHPMSHGCINIDPADAEKLYYWTNPPTAGNLIYASADNPGTPITIYGITPSE